MTAIEILQNLKAAAERLLGRLTSGSSRLYEINTAGAINERTVVMRDHFTEMSQQLQKVIDILEESHRR